VGRDAVCPSFSHTLHVATGSSGVDTDAWYYFPLDTIVISGPSSKDASKRYLLLHEKAHRAAIAVASIIPGSPFNVMRDLIGISHTLVRTLSVLLRSESITDTRPSNVIDRIMFVENIIDHIFMQVKPISELAALDFLRCYVDDIFEPVFEQLVKHPKPSTRIHLDLRHHAESLEAIELGPFDNDLLAVIESENGGKHVREAWSALGKIPSHAIRQQLLVFCMTLCFLRRTDGNHIYTPSASLSIIAPDVDIAYTDPLSMVPTVVQSMLNDVLNAGTLFYDQMHRLLSPENMEVVKIIEQNLLRDIPDHVQNFRLLLGSLRDSILANICEEEREVYKSDIINKDSSKGFLEFVYNDTNPTHHLDPAR
jgi:hypothetical protein